MEKPLEPAKLVATIERLLCRSSAEAPSD